MNSEKSEWAIRWLDSIASGANTMSQRKLSSGLSAVTQLARERRVHLVLLIDDAGDKLVAASRHEFKALC